MPKSKFIHILDIFSVSMKMIGGITHWMQMMLACIHIPNAYPWIVALDLVGRRGNTEIKRIDMRRKSNEEGYKKSPKRTIHDFFLFS
jgi:hypothetical protein